MRLTDSKLPSKIGLPLSRFADGPNVIVGKTAIPMGKAIVMAALYGCILVVLVVRSYAKMIRVYAGRVVAAVEGPKPVCDWAVVDLPRNAVRFELARAISSVP